MGRGKEEGESRVGTPWIRTFSSPTKATEKAWDRAKCCSVSVSCRRRLRMSWMATCSWSTAHTHVQPMQPLGHPCTRRAVPPHHHLQKGHHNNNTNNKQKHYTTTQNRTKQRQPLDAHSTPASTSFRAGRTRFSRSWTRDASSDARAWDRGNNLSLSSHTSTSLTRNASSPAARAASAALTCAKSRARLASATLTWSWSWRACTASQQHGERRGRRTPTPTPTPTHTHFHVRPNPQAPPTTHHPPPTTHHSDLVSRIQQRRSLHRCTTARRVNQCTIHGTANTTASTTGSQQGEAQIIHREGRGCCGPARQGAARGQRACCPEDTQPSSAHGATTTTTAGGRHLPRAAGVPCACHRGRRRRIVVDRGA